MDREPIPQRIPALTWRKPAFLWTPIGLALAIGWPGALFYYDATPQRFVLIAGAIVFAIALVSLGAGWAMGRAPRTRREVVTHVIVAAAIVCVLAPFVLTQLLAAAASGEAPHFGLAMSATMLPLALVVGLPIALVSGIVFAFVALTQKRPDRRAVLDDGAFNSNVQPFL